MPDTMICPNDQHKPLLSVHLWADSLMQKLLDTCGPKVMKKRCYPRTFSWKGIEVLPYRMYQGYLQLVRVLPVDKYIAIHGKPDRFRTKPHLLYVGEGDNLVPYYDDAETFLVHNLHNKHALEIDMTPLPPNSLTSV